MIFNITLLKISLKKKILFIIDVIYSCLHLTLFGVFCHNVAFFINVYSTSYFIQILYIWWFLLKKKFIKKYWFDNFSKINKKFKIQQIYLKKKSRKMIDAVKVDIFREMTEKNSCLNCSEVKNTNICIFVVLLIVLVLYTCITF